MTSIAYLDVNVWINGWLSQPNLVVIYKPAPTTDKTVKYKLVDMNGTVVTDEPTTTLTAGSTKVSINLGDFINAQKSLYGFGAGLYFVIAEIVEDNSVFALPLFISDVSISDPPTGRDNLDHIMVIDKITGFMMKLPPTLTPIPVDDRYMVYAYYHKEGKGRIVQFDGVGVVFDTGYHKYAKIKVTLKFNSLEDMIYHMLMRSWNIPEAVIEQMVAEINSGNYDEVFKILRPYYSFVWMGRVVKLEFDTVNYEITATIFTYLGQIDWGKVFGWGAIGCGVAVAAAVGFTIVTAGAGSVTLPLVAGACLSGGAVGAGIAALTSSSSGGDVIIINEARQTAEEGKKSNENYYNEAKNTLDEWKTQGKITQEDYDKMVQLLDEWRTKMNAIIEELVADVEKAYDEGKKKGISEAKWWIAGAGIGGLVLGVFIGKR